MNGAWIVIATTDDAKHGNTGDSDWYYRKADLTWSKQYVSDKAQAVQKALNEGIVNQMSAKDLLKLSSTEMGASGGFDTTTGKLSIATGLITGSGRSSSVGKFFINDERVIKSIKRDLDGYGTNITETKVSWGFVEKQKYGAFIDEAIKVYCMLTGDSSWTQCTRNAAIPGIVPAQDMSGKSIEFKGSTPSRTYTRGKPIGDMKCKCGIMRLTKPSSSPSHQTMTTL